MLPLEGHLPVNHNDSRLPSGPFQFRLMEKIDGWSWLLGGKSTAYIHQVVQSQWKPDQTPLDPPSLSLEEQAYLAVQTAEQEADPRTFLVGVYNNMVFAGMPERFWPDLENLDRYQRQDPEPDD